MQTQTRTFAMVNQSVSVSASTSAAHVDDGNDNGNGNGNGNSMLEALGAAPTRFECACLASLYSTCVDHLLARAAHYAASNACLCNAVHYARRTPVVCRPPPFASRRHAVARRSRPPSVSTPTLALTPTATSFPDSACAFAGAPFSVRKAAVADARVQLLPANSQRKSPLSPDPTTDKNNKTVASPSPTNTPSSPTPSSYFSKALQDVNANTLFGRPANGTSKVNGHVNSVLGQQSLNGYGRAPLYHSNGTKGTRGRVAHALPRFYYPKGVPPTASSRQVEKQVKTLTDELAKLGGRVRKHELGQLLRACNVPVYWKQAVWSCIRAQHTNTHPNKDFILAETFIPLWTSIIKECHDEASRFVRLLTCGTRDYVVAEDLVPLIKDVVDSHAGLAHLRAVQDFHLRYVQTVIARLFYATDATWSARLTADQLRRCNFLSALTTLQQDEDINNETDFFSYEHFYVIYCKFWELDLDHDLVIDNCELRRYQNGALSSLVTDRIFSATVIRNQLQKQDKMTYQDFVWFLLSEVDKRHPRSIEYWFRVMDMDGDGVLSMFELEHFYKEQLERMETLGITETLPFADCLCQILDMVSPRSQCCITLSDLKRSRHLCDIFFDTFVNVEKYLENEQRNPFAGKHNFADDGDAAKRWHAPGADWNRYAACEYETLVAQANEQFTDGDADEPDVSLTSDLVDSGEHAAHKEQDKINLVLDLSRKPTNRDRL